MACFGLDVVAVPRSLSPFPPNRWRCKQGWMVEETNDPASPARPSLGQLDGPARLVVVEGRWRTRP
jgi:hypothetical protein